MLTGSDLLNKVKELGDATEFMLDIKSALDPKGILNPGKIVAG